jgi:hypothetical protein
MPENNNSLPDLLELVVRLDESPDNPELTDIKVELRIATTDLNGPEDLNFTVGLKRAWLSLDLLGLELVPGSRFGEPTKPNQVAFESKFSKESTMHASAVAGASLKLGAAPTGLSASAATEIGGKRSTDSKTTSSRSATETEAHIRVKARGNLKWEVSEPPQTNTLDATYLDNEVICRAKAARGANAMSISMIAYARQRDVILELNRKGISFGFPSKNHEKMMKILISKAISSSNEKYNGTITLSESEIDLEK